MRQSVKNENYFLTFQRNKAHSPVPEACLGSKPAYLVSKLNTHLFQIGISPSIPIYRDVPGRMK